MINKNCPYCHKKMSEGYIQITSGVIAWTPKGVKKPLFVRAESNMKDGEVLLGKYTVFKEAKVIAYRCSNCKKVIIDEPENT